MGKAWRERGVRLAIFIPNPNFWTKKRGLITFCQTWGLGLGFFHFAEKFKAQIQMRLGEFTRQNR